ncbi:hypothetical protein [Haloarcula rubripromontorii]|uniref:hypothetical protein n=1 Tax=Haloarcula rubripromontorii TaxID=1705562 RepID=UPI00345BFD33
MQLSHLFAAFALLAGTIIVAGAGTLALDAAYSDTQDRYAESASDETTDELEVGLDLSSTLSQLLPLFAYAAVPLGLIGLLLAVGWATTSTTRGGMMR